MKKKYLLLFPLLLSLQIFATEEKNPLVLVEGVITGEYISHEFCSFKDKFNQVYRIPKKVLREKSLTRGISLKVGTSVSLLVRMQELIFWVQQEKKRRKQ